MKVSILVPVYGVEKYIEQCADSLFSQSYEDMEFVFVDDCSPDASIDILQRTLHCYPARQEQVKVVRHPVNRGLGASRKSALAASSGEFVLNVDSDDYLMPDAVRALVEVQQQTGADIVSGCYLSLLPDGRLHQNSAAQLDRELSLKLMLAQHTIPSNIWARLIRKRVYTENGIDSVEGVNMAEDYGLTPRLMLAARSIAHTDKAVYVYRLSSASSTFGDLVRPQHVHSFLRANALVCQYFQSHDSESHYAFALGLGMFNVYYKAMLAGFSRKQVSEECRYVPQQPLLRLCLALFAHKPVLWLLRFSYLAVKWCYKRWLGFGG